MTECKRNARTGRLALLGLGAAIVVVAAGGLTAVEAHQVHSYYDIVVDVLEYERTEYTGFDLVRMTVEIENLADFVMSSPTFRIGGPLEYEDDPLENPNSDVRIDYHDSTYAEVRARGGDVSVHDCTSADRFGEILPGGTSETEICFMVGKAFEPDALWIGETDPTTNEAHPIAGVNGCWTDGHATGRPFDRTAKMGHECYDQFYQVIPFTGESTYCFDYNFSYCNADNVQPIDGTAVPRPAPEPEQAEPAALLYSLYNNGTGTLTLVFDQLVVASNPDRIEMIHDIEAYIDDSTASGLGDAELSTVDNKRQSTILAFALTEDLRAQVSESLGAHGDLALVINQRAIYAAEGFVDVTESHPAGAILVTDLVVVR